MDEYPDPEDEFDMMYAQEMELIEELGYDEEPAVVLPKKSKKSLDFDKENNETATNKDDTGIITSATSCSKEMDSNDNIPSGKTTNQKENSTSQASCKDTQFEDVGFYEGPSTKRLRAEDITFQKKSARYEESFPKDATSFSCPRRKKRHLFRIVPSEPHETIMTPSGQKYYIRLKSEESLKHWDTAKSSKMSRLLSVPFSDLKYEVEKEIRKKSTISEDYFERRLHELEQVTLTSAVKKDGESGDLWVEKYKPRTYVELLSDESINRTLLHWLKLWDKAAFNREVKVSSKPKEETTKPKPSFMADRFSRFQKKNNESHIKEEFDSLGRPTQKIVLISGPPGLGKTTLAHIAAKHAGYNVVEMNASDDRNLEAFKTQLENATQMKSVISRDPRPNCLVIDEIDGAPAPSIAFLVNAVQNIGTSKDETGSSGNKAQRSKTKKKNGPGVILRPIICICNDLYVPALRPLRQIALVLQFPPTLTVRLAQRLFDISRQQKLKTDLSTLEALCQKAENDIRSCLATLYFVKIRSAELKLRDVCSSTIGQKDARKSFFQVWQDIFTIPRPKKTYSYEKDERDAPLSSLPDLERPLDRNAGSTITPATRFSNVLHSVQSCGDYDRLIQGVFENYLNVKFRDNYMNSVIAGLDLMCYYDIVNREIQHLQNYTMLPYIPYIFVGLHFNYAANTSSKLVYPTVMPEMNNKQSKFQNIVATLLQETVPQVRTYIHPENVVLDVVPFLLPIITPALRPVNSQLYSVAEKGELKHVIDVMIDYNVTYRQERTADGAFNYLMEPNIEELVRFDTGLQHRRLTYASKQMLAREVQLEKMRIFEAKLGPVNVKQTEEKAPKDAAESVPAVIPNHLKKLEPVKTVPSSATEKGPTDFFGRALKVPLKTEVVQGTTDIVKSDVWFHFKEGYSNAVRRNVKVSDFLYN